MPIDVNPVGNEVRKEVHRQSLGDDARCALCGEQDYRKLIQSKRSTLDKHHILGRKNDAELTIFLCRNCHAVYTESQIDAGVLCYPNGSRNIVEIVADCIYALAVFLQHLVDTLIQ